MSEKENEVDQMLKEVALLRYGPGSLLASLLPLQPASFTPNAHRVLCSLSRRAAGGGKSVFELKKEYEKEYSPFFYHYNRMDHSKVYTVRERGIT